MMAKGRRRVLEGRVTSDRMDKTIVVEVQRLRRHPRYERVVRRRKRFMAHDEKNTCRVGDLVRIEESRPLSRHKRWRLVAVLARAGKRPDGNVDTPVEDESGPTNETPLGETGQEPESSREQRDVGEQPISDTPGPEQSEGNTDLPDQEPTKRDTSESGPTNETPQGETGQEPESPDEQPDAGGQPDGDTESPEPAPPEPETSEDTPGNMGQPELVPPTPPSPGLGSTKPGAGEGESGNTGVNTDSGSRDGVVQADEDSQAEAGQPPDTDESVEPFAKEFFKPQTTTPSDAPDISVVPPPGGPKTEESAIRDTEEASQTGREGTYVPKTVIRWQSTKVAKALEGRFRSMVWGDYARHCQICGTTFRMRNGELQIFVVHIVSPRKDHRTNHFGNLVGLCGWHYALVQYGEWALLNPEADEPFGGWEYMQDFVLNASEEMDDEGNSYVSLPIRFWNVYQGWNSTPSTVDEEIRYSMPHWTYLRELLST